MMFAVGLSPSRSGLVLSSFNWEVFRHFRGVHIKLQGKSLFALDVQFRWEVLGLNLWKACQKQGLLMVILSFREGHFLFGSVGGSDRESWADWHSRVIIIYKVFANFASNLQKYFSFRKLMDPR